MISDNATGIALGVAFEIATHVVIHYTVPGAAFGAWLAESISPALDAVGLTTIFTESANIAKETAIQTSSTFLPSADTLLGR